MKIILFMILCSKILVNVESKHIIRKRQIYREQVLPHAGGKIPDSAFQVDRLALNRLQSEGIAVPDGVILEQRQHQVYPFTHKTKRPTFRVAMTPSGKHVASVGAYRYNQVPTIDTTYAVPQISGHRLNLAPKYPVKPSFGVFQLPSPEVKSQVKYQFASPTFIRSPIALPSNFKFIESHDDIFHPPPPVSTFLKPSPFHTSSLIFPNSPSFSIPNSFDAFDFYKPPPQWSEAREDFITASIFNDFESFFNDFHLRTTRQLNGNKDEKLSIDKH